MPDAGESEVEDGQRFPSELSKSNAIKTTPDGFTYLDPAQFRYYFASELPADEADFMARSQVLNLATNFKATITQSAWRTKPSWMLVAAADRAIIPSSSGGTPNGQKVKKSKSLPEPATPFISPNPTASPP